MGDQDPPPSSKKPGDISEPLRRVFEQVTTYGEDTSAELEGEIKQLEDLLARDPANQDIKEWLAFKLYSGGRLDKAVKLYKELIDKPYRPGVQYFYLGNTLYKMRRVHEAVSCWQKTVEMIPQDPKAQKAKARIEKAQKELAKSSTKR